MKEEMKNLLYILAGNTIYALAVTLFILPDGLITGGTTRSGVVFLSSVRPADPGVCVGF